MKIYLAARYSRAEEMRDVRGLLHGIGHEVTSRWIDHHGGSMPSSASFDRLNTDPAGCARFAEADVIDVARSNHVIVFTSAEPGKGGYHVEFGIALGRGIPVSVCGPRVNVFHTLPSVPHYATWEELMLAFSAETMVD